jgi:hypothetical protein
MSRVAWFLANVNAMPSERKVQVTDVRAAVDWWSGIDPAIPSKIPSRLVARRVFWAALRELGLSQAEIADASYCTPAAISLSFSHHEADPADVATVLQRAQEMVLEECKVTR